MHVAPESLTKADHLIVGSTVVNAARDLIQRRFTARRSGKPIGIETGFRDLDEILGGGFQPGQTYVFGAPPATGKSTLALAFSRTHSARGGRVIYISYEVGLEASILRALADITGEEHDDLLGGGVDPSTIAATHWSRLEAETKGIYFMDATDLHNRPQVDDLARAVELVKGVGNDTDPYGPLVVLDFLQLAARWVSDNDRDDTRARVARLSNILTGLARRFQVPVLILSSVARSAYDEPENLAAFKEAGDIESDADVAMILGPRASCKDWYTQHKEDETWNLRLRVLKNRHGKTNGQDLDFKRNLLRFTDPQAGGRR